MSCERYRDWMPDAAADELPKNRRMELENHARECAACREELQRVRTLLEAIDLAVTAQSAAEPSPRLIEQVRQRVRDEALVVSWWNARWVPAVACAAVLIVAASVWTLWPRTGARRELTVSSAAPSPVQAVRPAGAATTAQPKITLRRYGPMVALPRSVRRPYARRIERRSAAPEVLEIIVQPGQMEAVMQFAQALNSGQIDGAKLLADLKAVDQPLEIKPLVIAPLETPKLADDESTEGPAGSGEKQFVNSERSR
ncbi:MAG TPA: zf-HC2 domain-containing protein [Candidatus Acidoferrales bacterium]|nr:zf-HC2 domain-containing protein [Candidatus Acidoferrales bacterium]